MVLYLCIAFQHEHALFGSSIGAGGLLLWPAILAARTGIEGTWLLLVIVAMLVFMVIAWFLRNRKLALAPMLGFGLPIIYCMLGVFVFQHLAVPLPNITPYESDSQKKQEYLGAFVDGYRTGISGVFRTFCFAPGHTTRGYGDGQARANEIYYRCLGGSVYQRFKKNAPHF